MQGQFSELVPKLFKELEPAFFSIAFKYRVSNPGEIVKSWMSKAFEIVSKFDAGTLKKKVYSEQGILVEFNPEEHDDEEFITTLKYYLKQSFTNDIIRNYNAHLMHKRKEGETGKYTMSDYSRAGFSQMSKLMRYDNVTIKDIVKLVELDKERAASNKTTILDVIQEKFLQALLNYCNSIISQGPPWDELVVIPDIEENRNKEFFSIEFKESLEDGIRKHIAMLLVEEANPIIVAKLGVLMNPKNRGTLQKRILRYFFRYKKGYPARIRARIKSKTL